MTEKDSITENNDREKEKRERVNPDLQRAVDLYQEAAKDCGLVQLQSPKLEDLSSERQRKLKALIKDVGMEAWEKAIANLRKSKFLQGRKENKAWRADFDFILKRDKFDRVVGGTDNDRPQIYGRPGRCGRPG